MATSNQHLFLCVENSVYRAKAGPSCLEELEELPIKGGSGLQVGPDGQHLVVTSQKGQEVYSL